jgi:hypothetical protein
VLGHDPAPRQPPPPAVELVTLDDLLAASVSLHVPAVLGAPALVDGAALSNTQRVYPHKRLPLLSSLCTCSSCKQSKYIVSIIFNVV